MKIYGLHISSKVILLSVVVLLGMVLSIIGAVVGLKGTPNTRRHDAGIASVVAASVSWVPGFQGFAIIAGSLAIAWRNE